MFLAANPQGTVILVLVLLLLLLLTFTISGAEVALFSLNSKDLNMLKTKQHASAKRIVTLLETPKEVYASLLISGTFVNISIIVLSNFLINEFVTFNQIGPVAEILVKVLVIAFTLVFFGRILPKIWATQNNLRFAYGASSVIEGLHLVLHRISKWIVSLADNIGEKAGANKTPGMSIRELNEAIDFQSNEDITLQEKNIMKGVVKFSNISVKQIMRSRTQVAGITYQASFNELIHKIESLHYSRLPVYKENLDNVIGIINTKDIVPYLNEQENFDWHILLRQPYFVPETKLIEDLLIDFQQKRTHFAIVVDEFGGTSGIVTLEDILEEVIGDIRDEFDEEETDNYKLDDNNYIFDGRIKLHDMCRIMKLPMDTFDHVKGESESLAGLVLEVAGEFPSTEWVIPCGDFEFTIMEIQDNRIRLVKVTILPKT
jgi:gliding motility-associated protein GldE